MFMQPHNTCIHMHIQAMQQLNIGTSHLNVEKLEFLFSGSQLYVGLPDHAVLHVQFLVENTHLFIPLNQPQS